MTDQKNTVATPSAAVLGMADDLELVRALMGGTKAMREAANKYLPRWPKEDTDTYNTRLAVSTLFPAYSRTVTTLAGKPFSKPMVYGTDIPANIKKWMEDDADLQGRNLDTFAAGILQSALGYGAGGILVDVPKVEQAAKTQADEAVLGIRPYMIQIMPWNIIGWRGEKVNGVETLTQLRLHEYVSEQDGPFNEKLVEQVRVLTPGAWATWRTDAKGVWMPFENGVTSIKFIPYVPVYGERVDFMVSKPPMREMAHLNVKHWQSQSDQDNILHVCRVPILTVTGVDDDKFSMTIGASAAVKLPIGAAAGFVEHSGSALGAGSLSLDSLKDEMRQAGAELLEVKRNMVTATQIFTENAVGMCVLQTIVQGVEDALDLALEYCAKWINLPEGGHVTLFNDYAVDSLTDASATLLVGMRQAGDLSKKTLLIEMKRRSILSAEVDPDTELAAAEADGPPLGTMTAANDNAGPGNANSK